jgi:hypothetical protein
MTLLICVLLWAWFWLRPRQPDLPAEPKPLPDNFLAEARKTHPREMEAVDFASWELQMETEESP